jgi:ATP-dependent Clp protease ATP-binding subunit ClpA
VKNLPTYRQWQRNNYRYISFIKDNTNILIFIGEPAVGKTELTIALAELLFDNKKSIVRSEKVSVPDISRLVGVCTWVM